jgi:hypothetical protein
MIMDLTITGPGMFDLKNFLDYALELDVKIETKRMFAFHPDIVLSPMAWPRHILDEIVNDVLDYARPIVTDKQQTLIRELEGMLTAPTFQEEFPDTAEDQFFNGRGYQQIIHTIRKDGENGRLTLGDIYRQHPELWMWFSRPDKKHNQR